MNMKKFLVEMMKGGKFWILCFPKKSGVEGTCQDGPDPHQSEWHPVLLVAVEYQAGVVDGKTDAGGEEGPDYGDGETEDDDAGELEWKVDQCSQSSVDLDEEDQQIKIFCQVHKLCYQDGNFSHIVEHYADPLKLGQVVSNDQ